MRKVKGMTLEERKEYNSKVIAESAGPTADEIMAYIMFGIAEKENDTNVMEQYREAAEKCVESENLRKTRDQRLALTFHERREWNKIQKQSKQEEEALFHAADEEFAEECK